MSAQSALAALLYLGWLGMPLAGLATGLRGWSPWLYPVWLLVLLVPAIAFWPGPGEPNDTSALLPDFLLLLAIITLILEAVGYLVRRSRASRGSARR